MGIEDILFPKRCYGCGRAGSYICEDCAGKIEERPPICPECEKNSIDGWVHGRCRRSQGMDRLIAPRRYKGVIQKALKSVKYRAAWDVIERVAEVAWSGLPLELTSEWVVMGVPMYERKKKARGFNQAEMLGRRFAEKYGVEYIDGLERVRETRSQYGLSLKDRKENLKGAIRVKEGNVQEKVIVVDDVWTTGATMRECAKVLKRRGVNEVWGAVAGR